MPQQHDWRSLFSEIRVPWSDHGPNTSPRNINIGCPFCGSDPSCHLAVSNEGLGWFCFRDNRHRGKDPVRLLVALGLSRDDATRLLNRHLDHKPPPRPADPVAPATVQHAWDRFKPASTSTKCMEFLTRRGFASPRATSERFDLRVAHEGEWANRLLFPLTVQNVLISWTGRDVVGGSATKYRTQPAPGHPILYAPDRTKVGAIAVVVEGPMDGLRISDAVGMTQYISIATCGKSLNAAKLLEIRWLVSGCASTLLALDSDVPISQVFATRDELSSALKTPVIRLTLPEGCKDPCDVEPERILEWLDGPKQK